jgi:ABC-type multidrug transport system fused ATPase/permease subunit
MRLPTSTALRGVWELLKILPRVSPWKSLLLLGGVLAGAGLPVGATVAAGMLLGSIPPTIARGSQPTAEFPFAVFGACAGLIVGQRVLAPLLAVLARTFGREVDWHLQATVMDAVSRPVEIGHLEDPTVLDMLESVRGLGMGGIPPSWAIIALASLAPSWLQALGSAAVLLRFDPWLGVLWIVSLPLIVWYLQREFFRIGRANLALTAAVRRGAYLRDLVLTPGAAKEVRIWGLVDWLSDRFTQTLDPASAAARTARHVDRRVAWTSSGLVLVLNVGSYALLAWSASRGQIGLVAFAVYAQALVNANGLRVFEDLNAHLSFCAVSVPQVLAVSSRLSSPASPRGIEGRQDDRPPAIVCDKLTFGYPGSRRPILQDLELEIPAGRSLALVGPNGAGKTTLVKLICRLHSPTQGRILVDGTDLCDVSASEWRRHVSVLFQDFVQYHMSVRENVAMGALHIADDETRLRSAAVKAGVLDLIERLPRDWDTVLSRQYPGGVELSGGQWQRIALARALFAVEGGARVLILDEPTSNLDARIEAMIYDRLLEHAHDVTICLISHRFSTVRRADRIAVLSEGAVVELGTHAQLMAAGQLYARMFSLQATQLMGSPVDPDSWLAR